jgi:exodeoxyribonuclease VII large subunit
VVIVGRGGGSREDLWTFNAESVARAVAAVRVPTVAAVGHETDVTLTDLVADVRAPTPSAAAETVVPDRREQAAVLRGFARRLQIGLGRLVEVGAQRLDRTHDRLVAAAAGPCTRARSRLDRAAATLEALSPLRVLGRGYALARDPGGRVLRRRADFPAGTAFRLTVQDGDVAARAEGPTR